MNVDQINTAIAYIVCVGAWLLIAGPLLCFVVRDLIDAARGRTPRPWRWRSR